MFFFLYAKNATKPSRLHTITREQDKQKRSLICQRSEQWFLNVKRQKFEREHGGFRGADQRGSTIKHIRARRSKNAHTKEHCARKHNGNNNNEKREQGREKERAKARSSKVSRVLHMRGRKNKRTLFNALGSDILRDSFADSDVMAQCEWKYGFITGDLSIKLFD